jgi:predicted ATP-dependent endonuclease of OLD family
MGALTPLHFRVTNYRNVDDSGWIELAQVTALVGRNESGKTALLKALHKFNPATQQHYHPQREFPRDRFTREFRDGKDWPVCAVEFEIADSLRAELVKLTGGAEPAKRITYTRYYDGSMHYVLDPSPSHVELTYAPVAAAIGEFKAAAMRLTHKTPDQEATYQSIRTDLMNWTDAWIAKFSADESLRREAGQQLLKALREESNTKARPEVANILTPFQSILAGLIKQAAAPRIDEQIEAVLRSHIPVFIYFDNYGILDSAVYLPRFLEDMKIDPENPRIRTINAMFKHVNLTAQEIADLARGAVAAARSANQQVTPEMIAQDQERMELRRIKLNSASNDITKRFSEWWEQRRHNIRYDADGDFFRIWVADDRRPGIDIELEGRSAGFQWFFSFYLVFLVESEEGHKDAVLLLDEPGLHLHPTAQQELISFFEEISKRNQLLYSTHSPFLIDGEHIERVRPVTEDDTGHSRISNDSWPRDRDTIFPLQAAAGYAMVKGLFRHKKNVLVEGMSEYFYLNALSILCRAKGKTALAEDAYVTPCGGTKLVGHLASLFLGQQVRPLILLDADDAGRVRRDALMKELYVGREKAILMLNEVLGQADCEIEDLIGATLFLPMASKVLGHRVTLNAADKTAGSLPDQIKAAATRLGIALPDGWKAEVARQFAIEWAKADGVPNDLLDRAEKLFREITERFAQMSSSATA